MSIEFRDVHKTFGEKKVLMGVTLRVEKGEVMFIIGTSGVGKSVTIKHLIGLLILSGVVARETLAYRKEKRKQA